MFKLKPLIQVLWAIILIYPISGLGQSEILKIGAASTVITPELNSWVQGAGVPKKATKVRDDLEANGLYISKGRFQMLLVSCDLVGMEAGLNVRLREAMGVATGIMPRDILISSTHTHGGPSLVKTNYLMPLDTAYMESLVPRMVSLAKEAVKNAVPGKIGWAEGEAQIGYNRRLTWADGTHSMHGDASRTDFAGLEGPDDPQHLAMFAADLKGNLLSILYHNTTHPTIFYADGVFSSDFPGEVRKTFREQFRDNLPVLFLNGAQGDISMENMLDKKAESDEEKMARITELVVRETMRLYESITYETNPKLAHEYHDLKVKVRLPDTGTLVKSQAILKRIDEGEPIRGMEMIMAFGSVHLQETFGENPFDILPVHALRIGGLAMVTQPCELFSQFGLDIKRRSPGESTIVVGMTDGYNGYCPTIYGLLGGGYSGSPISWTRLEPEAGYKIVDTAAILLNKIWTK
jgi:hypothetical protein